MQADQQAVVGGQKEAVGNFIGDGDDEIAGVVAAQARATGAVEHDEPSGAIAPIDEFRVHR